MGCKMGDKSEKPVVAQIELGMDLTLADRIRLL